MEDYREALAEAIDYQKSILPVNVKRLIAQANFDLYYGPSGNDDDYPGFSIAVRAISDWAEDVPNVSIEVNFNEETGESSYEDVPGSARDIIFAIVGRELHHYL